MHRAVFLDRDDTLTDTTRATAALPHPGDLVDPGRLTLLPGVHEACTRLAGAGFLLVVISNQASVARANATVDDVHAVNARLFESLPASGQRTPTPTEHPHVSRPTQPSLISAVYFCPWHPHAKVDAFRADHPWRKPAPGMITSAAHDLDIDLDASWLVGDAPRDVEAGVAAGISPGRCILLDDRVPTLAAAANLILGSGDA